MIWLIIAVFSFTMSVILALWVLDEEHLKTTDFESRITRLSATSIPRSWEGDVGSFKVRDRDYYGQNTSTGTREGE